MSFAQLVLAPSFIPNCSFRQRRSSASVVSKASRRLPFFVSMRRMPTRVMRPSAFAMVQMRRRVKLDSAEVW